MGSTGSVILYLVALDHLKWPPRSQTFKYMHVADLDLNNTIFTPFDQDFIASNHELIVTIIHSCF